ncbi:ras-related small GTP-binding family protein [Actinidia rufa]|uniref:Ras-related small GTP-binding family protein n=1 Tax=Actinidia rufa TaxID=165716 RepID=A0A7J0G2A3_9ERIC|nr:ras-related small GTP-binding family protein [Actinidia rufa]
MADARSVTLTEVRHVPNLRKNLILLGARCKDAALRASGGIPEFPRETRRCCGKEDWRAIPIGGNVQIGGATVRHGSSGISKKSGQRKQSLHRGTQASAGVPRGSRVVQERRELLGYVRKSGQTRVMQPVQDVIEKLREGDQVNFEKLYSEGTQLCRKIVHANVRRSILERGVDFPAILSVYLGENPRLLPRAADSVPAAVSPGIFSLGEIKYVGDEQEKRSLEMKGLNLMDKTLLVQGARIAFRLWDVGGDHRSMDQVPIACKDAVAILFMFDLTSRCTLNSVIGWYNQARKWNQTAIPILIGTKFDDFVQLPPDVQWTIVTQARAYARAMNATLFFSSSTHNINVNKIFKFIMAKLFNLPWTVERNLTLGEPTIDF